MRFTRSVLLWPPLVRYRPSVNNKILEANRVDTYAVATKPRTQHYSNIVHTPSKKKLNTVNKEIVTSYELITKVSASFVNLCKAFLLLLGASGVNCAVSRCLWPFPISFTRRGSDVNPAINWSLISSTAKFSYMHWAVWLRIFVSQDARWNSLHFAARK